MEFLNKNLHYLKNSWLYDIIKIRLSQKNKKINVLYMKEFAQKEKKLAQNTDSAAKKALAAKLTNNSKKNNMPMPALTQALWQKGLLKPLLKVGEVNDNYEREADKVADHVMRTSLGGIQTRSTPSVIQRRIETPAANNISVPNNFVSNLGTGQPLDKKTRNFFEPHFGNDLSGVRIHTNTAAAESASSIGARAYTLGNNIVFGTGEYQPETSQGQRLMAHELTHVLQQGGNKGNVQREVIQRTASSQPVAESDDSQPMPEPDARRIYLETFRLPLIKRRHLEIYRAWANRTALKRIKNYNREDEGGPNQKDAVWIPRADINPTALSRLDLAGNFTGQKTLIVGNDTFSGTKNELIRILKVPFWNRAGDSYGQDKPMEVDHIVELQVGGWSISREANDISNMELLDKSSNASSGNATRNSIRKGVRDYKRAQRQSSSKNDVDTYLRENDIVFNNVELREGGRDDSGSHHWTLNEIKNGEQIGRGLVRVAQNIGEAGSPTSFALISPGRTMVIGLYPHRQNQFNMTLDRNQQTQLRGLHINNLTLNPNYTSIANDAQIGNAQVSYDLNGRFTANNGVFNVPIKRATQYSGYLDELPSLNGTQPQASPFAFDTIRIEGRNLVATGRLIPTIPLINRVPIQLSLHGKDIEASMTYSTNQIYLPIPGIDIDDVSLEVFFGTSGLGVEGSVDFSVHNLGHGSIAARITSRGFEAAGTLHFDRRLFDTSEIMIWYRNNQFGGQGNLRINGPNKIRGIRRANITARYDNGTFSAQGSVLPSIPGIQEAGLSISYSEAEGLLIAGDLQLANNIPGISGGVIHAEVRKQNENWKLFANGNIRPRIPYINTILMASYNDGIFLINGQANYNHGMLSGEIQLGATNQRLDANGRPIPGGEPASAMNLYGGGTLTARLAPWLQGTAGVKLLPNGEIQMMGEIALPSSLNLFDEKRFDKNIFNLGLDIPIIGVTVPVIHQRIGVFATVRGGLDANAGIGPGQLRQLRLGITYNPSREQDTRVTGAAELFIPARAGLRLFVRGGLGVGIPIVSASANLEVGGQLGLEGAARAAVNIDWTPARGVVLDARGEIYVEPKFKFDVTGMVLVEADVLLDTVELYSKRWRLASFEYGSNMRFGVLFPIHYEEGRPFDISFNDVQFITPQIDTTDILTSLIRRIA